jgi:2,5-diketo-D-gluconate reductase B
MDDSARETPVPPFGLGTWDLADTVCTHSVVTALETGYRHIDTAQLYGNEAAVGAGIARAAVPREEVWLATKVDPERLGGDDLRTSVRESRDRLGVETIDCVYVHWPRAAYDPETTLPALADLVDRGLVGGIGLSNFTPALLDEARDVVGSDRIVAHQVECHPLLPQAELHAYARRHGHALVAYSPLARGQVFDIPEIEAVAAAHDASAAQVTLAWLRAHDVVPIPKSSSADHIVENYRGFELELTTNERERIDAIQERTRLVDPPSAPWN